MLASITTWIWENLGTQSVNSFPAKIVFSRLFLDPHSLPKTSFHSFFPPPILGQSVNTPLMWTQSGMIKGSRKPLKRALIIANYHQSHVDLFTSKAFLSLWSLGGVTADLNRHIVMRVEKWKSGQFAQGFFYLFFSSLVQLPEWSINQLYWRKIFCDY